MNKFKIGNLNKKNMSIVICFNNKDPKPWKDILQMKLKDVIIEIYPEVKEPQNVTFALCWKPNSMVLDKFPNLKVIQSVGASVEHIFNNQCIPSNCAITRIVDHQLSKDMFEFILTGIMRHIKRFPEYQMDQELKLWHQKPYKRITDVNIGILGLGKIGSYVAEQLAQLGFKVKAWSTSEKTIKNVECYHSDNGLKNVLNATNILINILPLTEETRDILHLKNLEELNKNGYLINVGRGEHLVENDLLTVLNNNHLSGALLDVFRTEPLPKEHPFWIHNKIEITPHIAAITNLESASDIIVKNYKNLINGRELLYRVSSKKRY